MTSNPLHRLVALTLLACAAAPIADAQVGCRPPAALAGSLVAEGRAGDLDIRARYSLDEETLIDEGRLVATLEAELGEATLRSLPRPAAICVAWVAVADAGLLVLGAQRIEIGDAGGATAWRYRWRGELPEGSEQLLAVVQAAGSTRWGVAPIDEAGEPIPATGQRRVAGTEAWWELIRPAAAPAAPAGPRRGSIVRLVPPRAEPVRGGTRVHALVSSEAVDRVAYELDGERVADRRRRPFGARIEFADPPREQLLVAIAFDRDGREMGRDRLEVNRRDRPFRVRITGLEGDPADGEVEVTAEITVPSGARLSAVELYRNDELLARSTEPLLRARVATPDLAPDDFVRVAATLADGSSIDDVVLLAAPGNVDEVEVNLVELHAVVTDADNVPIADLRPDELRVLHEGRVVEPASFAFADDVPLLLGLVVDTSGSMLLLMHDTRRAAAKFLGTTVLPKDRAFIVDFADRPRLLRDTTGDLSSLMLELARLRADGRTALYDAVVFSMVQFEQQPGRKALVVLSDGDDLDSRFGPKDCIEYAQRLGVPIYVIGLGALDTIQRSYSKRDLRRVTGQTGGRLYFVDSIEELGQAYAEINAELRSQYTVGFYAERDLTDAERRQIEVEVTRAGSEARTVVGSRVDRP